MELYIKISVLKINLYVCLLYIFERLPSTAKTVLSDEYFLIFCLSQSLSS